MNGNHAPSALDAELLEEGGSGNAVVADKSVGVEEGAADDAAGHDGEAAAKELAQVADGGAADDGAEVGDDLGDGDHVGGEAELVAEHDGVDVLAAVGHEVEAGHEEDEVDEDGPVAG